MLAHLCSGKCSSLFCLFFKDFSKKTHLCVTCSHRRQAGSVTLPDFFLSVKIGHLDASSFFYTGAPEAWLPCGVCLCLFWLWLAWLSVFACLSLLMDIEVGLALFSWRHTHYLGVKSTEVYFLLCHLSKYHCVYITHPASLRTPAFPWRERLIC